MHLLFVTNDAYVPHVATTLCSIFENNMDMDFCVHVMATNISDDNLRKLQQFVKGYHHELDVKVINPDELEIDLSICGKWGIFPSLKLYAADLYPKVSKMLYMDADMIGLGRLKAIEEIDMTHYYIAASTDEQGAEKHKQRLGLPKEAFYGCAGLVWFNLDKWRTDKVRERCFSYFNNPANKEIIKWAEQDVLNKVCQGYISELPIVYNMFSYYWLHHGRNIPERYKSKIDEYKRKAVIIHYIDACKPWFNDCLNPQKYYYWRYHQLTPWKGEKYGHSKVYGGYVPLLKNRIKQFLHRWGIRKYDYSFDR